MVGVGCLSVVSEVGSSVVAVEYSDASGVFDDLLSGSWVSVVETTDFAELVVVEKEGSEELVGGSVLLADSVD